MPYISAERVKEIRNQLKKEFPDVKFSVTRYHGSTVNIFVLAAPIKFDLPRGYADVHYYHIKSDYNEEQQKFLSRIRDIANQGNKTIVEDSDYGNVPNFYYNVSLGDYEKPYQYIEPKGGQKKEIKEVVKERKKYILSKFQPAGSSDWKFYFTTIEDWENGGDEIEVPASEEVGVFTEKEASDLINQIKDVIASNK